MRRRWPWIYHRREGSWIRLHRIGVQWWHGPVLFWRTQSAIYRWSWFERRCSRTPFTLDDHLADCAQLLRCTRDELRLFGPFERDFYA